MKIYMQINHSNSNNVNNVTLTLLFEYTYCLSIPTNAMYTYYCLSIIDYSRISKRGNNKAINPSPSLFNKVYKYTH
jgi:hypothetical protein